MRECRGQEGGPPRPAEGIPGWRRAAAPISCLDEVLSLIVLGNQDSGQAVTFQCPSQPRPPRPPALKRIECVPCPARTPVEGETRGPTWGAVCPRVGALGFCWVRVSAWRRNQDCANTLGLCVHTCAATSARMCARTLTCDCTRVHMVCIHARVCTHPCDCIAVCVFARVTAQVCGHACARAVCACLRGRVPVRACSWVSVCASVCTHGWAGRPGLIVTSWCFPAAP